MEKGQIKIKLNMFIFLIIILIIIMISVLTNICSNLDILLLSKQEIKDIADDSHYEIRNKGLKAAYDELYEDGLFIIVSKKTAGTLEEAKKIVDEYKETIQENYKSYDIQQDFIYIDLKETEMYYKYILKIYDKWDKQYYRKYGYLIFKKDFFDYPYLKKHNKKEKIKKFGNLLAVLHREQFVYNIVKSNVKETATSYIYEWYYVTKEYMSKLNTVMSEEYYLKKSKFIVNKITGKTNLIINKDFHSTDKEYDKSYYPTTEYWKRKTLVEFSK